jgi:hypothetical protein
MRRSPAALTLLAATVFTLCLIPNPHPVQAANSPTTPSLTNPDAACARCHAAIYARYEQTPMAQGSGLATDTLQTGHFHHTPSNIDYTLFSRNGEAVMSFQRTSQTEPLQGERPLTYFIGSGRHGRTYLYQLEGQWFELPINFYTRRNTWAMAPAFDDARTMPAVLPVDPNCLHCHATAVQTALPTARNRFANAPFLQGGIGCSACHGDPTQHLSTNGHAPILNPSKLSPARRDSACIQCHLEGNAVVYRPGHDLAHFQPGEDLADTAVYFVRASQQSGGSRASSQYEALLRSACKRATGDRLTCTSCHDPHSTPTAAERMRYFRARCLACHTSEKMATHHPEQPDCASCHMPTRPTTDISHEQLTDHDIEARPNTHPSAPAQDDKLLPVGDTHATTAEYGMAYAQLAAHGNRFDRDQALRYLTQAAAQTPSPTNPLLYAQLGFLKQTEAQLTKQPSRQAEARAAYQTSLQQDPYQPTALANLAVLDASTNQLEESIHLLDRLIQADPSQTPAGLNLAWIECKLGHPTEALHLLYHLDPFNPDDSQLRAFLTRGDYAGQHCNLSINNAQ